MEKPKMEYTNSVKFTYIILIVILSFQLFVIAIFGTFKESYHVDELYTYGLSNSYFKPFLVYEEESLKWHSPEFYQDYLTVQETERFAYESVYYNQTNDVHPPLYYYGIHTISSMFPNAFSKWIGISFNMVFFSGTIIFLFLLSKLLFEDKILSIVICIAYGFSAGAISYTIFIRMYMMLTFFTVLTTYLHGLMISEKQHKVGIIYLIIIVNTFGFLTQYLFIIYSFFIASGYIVYLLKHRRWKAMNYYIIAMTSFIGVCTIIFPEYLFHIFLGYRGRETFENFSLIQDFLTRVYSFILLMCKSLVIVPILIIIILTLTFLHIKQRRSGLLKGDNLLYSIKEIYNSIIKDEKNVLFSIVFYSTIISFLIITKISNLSQDRYDRYISFLFPIISMITFFISYIIVFAFIKDKVKSLKMLTLITSICTVISYFSGSVNYLFMEKTDYLDVLSEYTDSDAYCVATKINDMTIAIPLISQHKKSCYVSNADEILNNRSENGKEESIVVYFPNWKNLKIAELDTLNNLVESNEFSTYTQLVTREKSGLATSIYILE